MLVVAARAELDPAAPTRRAAASIFAGQLVAMEQAEAGTIAGQDPKFLHDYRVALRRTRTALRLFKNVFTPEEYRDFRKRFRALSGPTGALRDLDVHIGSREQYTRWVPAKLRAHLAPTFASLLRRRNDRREQLATVLSGSEYAGLKRDWRAAIARLRGRRAPDEAALPTTRHAIASRYERLRAIAADPDTLDGAALHRARVHSKRLRYMLEFFAVPLGEPATVAAKGIERLQDALGAYHDAVVLEPILQAEIDGIRAGEPDAVKRAAALGACLARLEVHREKARRRAVRRIEKLKKKKIEGAIRRITETN